MEADLEHADERVIETLVAYDGNSVAWPTDDELRAELPTRPMYSTFTKNARLAYLLRCIENFWRDAKSEAPMPLSPNVQVEHLIPKSWRDNWALHPEPADTFALRQSERDGFVHRLGNLTLVSPGMNLTMSNSAWSTKQCHLRDHSTVLLTSRYREKVAWNENEISARGKHLIDTILVLWPGPTGALAAPPPV